MIVKDNRPIFIQIMENIESDIITNIYQVNDIIISTTEISKLYSVNPTTAVKAISKLTDAGILYKKRGIGMCVAEGAKEIITQRRRGIFLNESIEVFLKESQMLGFTLDEVITLLKEKQERKKNDD